MTSEPTTAAPASAAATAPPPPVLDLTRLTRRYGTLTAVDDVSLRLPAGARHAVIGPNGAGKTTLLNLIAGTDRPDHGTIALDGADITRTPTARRSRLGIARSFQQPSVIAELSVLDNVVLAGFGRTIRSAAGHGAARPATGSTPSPRAAIWRPWGWRTSPAARPRRSRTGSAACSTSPPRWQARPGCCSWTSPRPD